MGQDAGVPARAYCTAHFRVCQGKKQGLTVGQDAGVPAGGASAALCQSIRQRPCHRHLDARACTNFRIHGVGFAWRQLDVEWDARVRVHNLLTPALRLVVHLLIPAANHVGLAGSDMKC